MSIPAPPPTDANERVQRYLDTRGLTARALALTSDASDRRYYRILGPDEKPFVLAVHNSAFDYAKLPFVNVADLLLAMPVPIPRIVDHVDELGILALEDLGDVTLQAHLGVSSPIQHAALYRQAVGLIATLQRRGAELSSPASLPYGIAFDVDKFTWELDFFLKHFVEGYRGAQLNDADREALREEFRPIIHELAGETRVLCHRDYHSRNLMMHEGLLYMIDFQDARMGPDTYDLVSLLRDSYVDLPEVVVDELIAFFLALKAPAGSLASADEAAFRERFDLMALQRNLKALGTFGYQAGARQNPVYIQYIPRTIRYVRQNLTKYERFARLRELLAPHISELR
jgi:aminoglycoside/choline kinase family phosphotransferase